jgi:glycine dehydrogenase subunit 1
MRYLPHTDEERAAMLSQIGATSINDLYQDVPKAALLPAPLGHLPYAQGEMAVEAHMTELAARNIAAGDMPCFLGGGAYRHHIPAAVDYLIQRGEFLTSYTPYQPEVSQGTLQMLFEFQTQVARLTGLDVANASMYDGATAAMEAAAMANRVTGRREVILAGNLHPHYRETITTFAAQTGFQSKTLAPNPLGEDLEALCAAVKETSSCLIIQMPDFYGHVFAYERLSQHCAQQGALLVVVVTEAVSFGLLPAPGEMGADITVAEGQSLGNPLGFGGPYVGLFACRERFLRQMPGRLCGLTQDKEGRRGFVLTLSTREQHIRREKATSNICTNAGLCALAFSIHLALLGEEGLKQLARLNHLRTVKAAELLSAIPGVSLLTPAFFNEITLRLPCPAAPLVEYLAKERKAFAGIPLSRFYADKDHQSLLLLAVTETVTEAQITALAAAVKEAVLSS